MDWGIWALLLMWLPLIWCKLHDIWRVLKDIRDSMKKGGDE